MRRPDRKHADSHVFDRSVALTLAALGSVAVGDARAYETSVPWDTHTRTLEYTFPAVPAKTRRGSDIVFNNAFDRDDYAGPLQASDEYRGPSFDPERGLPAVAGSGRAETRRVSEQANSEP